MCRLVVKSPTRLEIIGATPKELEILRMNLTYDDEKARWAWSKHKNSSWYADKYGAEAHYEKLAELKAAITQCLLFETDGVWTYSGLSETVSKLLNVPVENQIKYPPAKGLPWLKKPPFDPYPYQIESEEKLLAIQHGCVELATGLGKTLIILMLCRTLGLRTVVMAPSKDIARRLLADLQEALGRKVVGFYGDGKKESHKLITVAIAQSLTRIEEGSKAWEDLSRAQVFIADESHQTPAVTFAKVCFGLVANAPYRFFFSATQMRGDGLDLLLEGITGPVMVRMSVREGIEGGYLAPLEFTVVEVTSHTHFYSKDSNEMTRAHLFYNDKVNQKAGDIVNQFIEHFGSRVLILIEELEQFTKLLPYLKHQVRFAHGGVTKENKDKLPQPYHDSDPSALIKSFNKGEFPILVGTSCISTGSDLKANSVTINLCGGKSEIQVLQGPVGRSTRWLRELGKTNCHIIDFDVTNQESLHRHAVEREKIYQEIAPVRRIQY